ncbi:hypothetical protein H2O64_19380 [Kordia sp. YSTF-M3]|uniref:DUF4347 domain-containing protein n=1 Tax=Kordia aestuariivivens TaxID=2759037 RepID=A0ABR7QE79_9FLAO|nr:hypothetical protein [Kordia aestuariivivens]MBC8756845.1 hypothetical protein [Kordia aestuariivivens]
MKKLFILVLLCFSVSAFAGTETTQLEVGKPQPLVFIAGFDEGDNTYYTNAKKYFDNENYQVVEKVFSLAEILTWLRLHYDSKLYSDIHIVSHSNPWRGLSMKTSETGERITETNLAEALQNKEIVPLAENFLPKGLKIIFHSCGLGKNKTLLISLKKAFTHDATLHIYASELFNVFGGKYAEHYLAKTYYGYYPTAHSPGPRMLASEFKQKYPTVKADWETVLKTRAEQLPGELHTYRFNIPVEWEFEFEEASDIPNFSTKQQIMDWISENEDLVNAIMEFNIPIEKFRWLTKIRGNTLTIKGKTTVLCVMQPVMKSNNKTEYSPIDIHTESYTKV